MSRDVVPAAGGVISRRTERGEVEVLLVHRAHREDWTFPKGKVDASSGLIIERHSGEGDATARRRLGVTSSKQ